MSMYHTAGKSLYSFRGYHSMLILRRWMARTVYPVWIMCGIMNIMYTFFFQISLVWLAVVIRFVVRENTHMLNWFFTCSTWLGGVWCWATGLSAMPFEVDSIIVDMYNRRLPSYLVWCITILFLTNVNGCCNDSCLCHFLRVCPLQIVVVSNTNVLHSVWNLNRFLLIEYGVQLTSRIEKWWWVTPLGRTIRSDKFNITLTPYLVPSWSLDCQIISLILVLCLHWWSHFQHLWRRCAV